MKQQKVYGRESYKWKSEFNCEFENVTPAELIASKFVSVIGVSTGDYELKRKFGKAT